MITSTVLSVVAMGFIIAIVGTEVRAAATAIQFGLKFKAEGGGPRLKGPQPLKKVLQLMRLRYFFGSFIFHEVFAKKHHLKPAYSIVNAALIFFLPLIILRVAGMGGEDLTPMMGAGFLVAGTHFAAAYGPAFLAYREKIAKVTAKGNVFAFTA